MADKRYGVAEAAKDVLFVTHPELRAAQLGVDLTREGYKLFRANELGEQLLAKWTKLAKEAHAPRDDGLHDAMRHAEWMSQLAREFGPDFARMIGALNERVNRGGGPYSTGMDNYNNEVAVRSVEEGRPYTRDDLQLSPVTLPRRMPGVLEHYMKEENWPPALRQRMREAERQANGRRR